MNVLMRFALLTVIIAAIPSQAGAEQLGRFFTTPEQRLKLDTLRYTRVAPEPVQPTVADRQAEQEAKAPEVFDKSVNFKGFVSRGDSGSTAWLNDTSTLRGDLSLGRLEIRSIDRKTGRIRILVPGRESEVPLKVGESYDPLNESSK